MKSQITPAQVKKLLDNITPGPWYVIIDDDGNPLSGRPSVEASEEYDCSIVHQDGFVQEFWRSARGDKEIHTNASLIAAAPDIAESYIDAMAEKEVFRAIVEDFCYSIETGKPFSQSTYSFACKMLDKEK